MKRVLFVITFILGFTMNVNSQRVLPILKNFRVESSNTSRVYFDVNGDISELSSNGFIITGKKITGLNTSSNYFTVDSPFTYWDNNTIRLEGGNGVVHDFTLQYIKNNIPEPSTSKTYYVSTNGDNGSSGTSEDSAWRTIEYAASQVTAGSTVYIKAGNYGSEEVRLRNNGSVDSPIKFIGYKNTPGDSPRLHRSQQTVFDSNEMPLLKTSSRSGSGITTNKSFVIVRNLQVDGYYKTVLLGSADYQVLDNIYVQNSGKECITSNFSYSSKNHRIINSYVKNASDNGIFLAGSRHLIDNVYSCSYGTPDMDYLIAFHGGTGKGGRNIVRNTEIVADPADTHSGHGLSIKSNGYALEYCLIENVTIQDVGQAFELRHHQVRYNVLRGCVGKGDREGDSNFVTFRDDASYNIVEGGYADSVKEGIKFNMNKGEDLGIQAGGHHNKIINTIFNNPKYHILVSGIGATPLESTHNEFINCTFYGGKYLYTGSQNFGNSNKIINSIFKEVPSKSTSWSAGSTTLVISNTNSDNSFSLNGGSNNYSLNSELRNPEIGDFRLKESSKLRNKGVELDDVKTDFDGNVRPDGNGIDLGAFEYKDNSTSFIKAEAGSNQTICLGEETIITASGGSSYLWNNGSTDQSLKVQPDESTTYSVTVFEGDQSDTDEVTVFVEEVVANAGADVIINEGESTTLTATGGESYIWSTGETGSSITVSPDTSTTYFVTAKSNNCEDTDEINVEVSFQESFELKADAGPDQTICLGEETVLTADGGSTYLWSNGSTDKSIKVQPNESTTYSVTVFEGNQSDTDEVSVYVEEVIADAGSDVNINEGESITLIASGGDEYLWSNGETTSSITVRPSNSTKYSVLAKKNGCQDIDEVFVYVISSANEEVYADAGSDKTICLGESVTLNATGGSEFLWSTGETSQNITVNPESTTTYELEVFEGELSSFDYVTVFVNECENQVSNLVESSEIFIYPNPTTGQVNLESNASNPELDIHLINSNGQILIHDKMNSGSGGFSKQLDLSSFTRGIYFVRIFSVDKNEVKKIVLI